jgi:uncharacterized protein
MMRMLTALVAMAVLALSPAWAATAHVVETITIRTHSGPRTFRMEVAADEASRELGLMHRKHLARDAGMLFDFQGEVMTSFWMKDTPLPLDMLFVRADGTISTIYANAAPFSLKPISSAEPVRAVIEINGGLAKTLGIGPGDRVSAPIFPKIGRR